jgi:ABC-type glycerol-3-phosphate transport system permease component
MEALTLGHVTRRVWIYLCALAMAVFCGFPLFWMALTSLKIDREILTSVPVFWPSMLQTDAYQRLFSMTNFATYFVNSITVAAGATILNMIVATLAAYGITRSRFRGRDLIATIMLFTYMFAPIMIIVPFYVMVRFLGLTNTHTGLVMAYTAFCLPFNLWMLRTFFQSIPVDIEEAAMIDGANRFQAVVHVVFPLALPGVVATGIFTFILAWNDYIFARVLLSADELKTLPVGIADLYNASVVDWGMIMASGLLVIAPIAGVFVFIQKYLVAGWGAGGVKG